MPPEDEKRKIEAARAAADCRCEFCVRDGPHEPDCGVHREGAPAPCTCGRTEQSKGAS